MPERIPSNVSTLIRNIIIALLVALSAGVIVAIIAEEGRFAPGSAGPTQALRATLFPTAVPPMTTAPTEASVIRVPTIVPSAVATNATPMTITIWHAYATGGSEEKTLTQLVALYMKDNPNVTVNIQQIPLDQIFDKWQIEVASGGTAADIFTAPNDFLGNWVRAGVVAPLDRQLAGKLGGVSQTGIDGVTVDGHIYAVPGIIKAVALYYNKSAIPNPPATTADLLALVKSGKQLVLNENDYHNYGFFTAFGGQLMDSTGKCTADQGGYADAMQYLVDLKAAGASFQTDGGKADTLFKTGAADMIINGPWVLGDYKTALADRLGVAPMPAGPKGPAKPLTDIDGFYVNPNSQNTDAALQLAQYIFSPRGLATYADQAGDPPARTDVTVADPLVKAFADAAAAGTSRPQSQEFGNWWGPFGDMVTKVVEGQQNPADGVKAACDAMNKTNGFQR